VDSAAEPTLVAGGLGATGDGGQIGRICGERASRQRCTQGCT